MRVVKSFVDTNILVYAHTASEPIKQEIALKSMRGSLSVISTQVIKEFANVLLKQKDIDYQLIQEAINDIIDAADVISEDLDMIFASFDIHKRYKYSFYDCLIIAAAMAAKCQVLLSEDMQHGQIIDGKLRIVNPFNEEKIDI